MTTSKVEWKWVDGYPNYAVSSDGQIRCRAYLAKRGKHLYVRAGHSLNLDTTKQGYSRVKLYIFDGKKTGRWFFVHRVVAMMFIENTENKPFINHINGVKTDNRIENLEWCTVKENQRHAVISGFYKNPKGEQHRMVKISEKDVIDIRNDYNSGVRQHALAAKYNITQSHISCIVTKKCWVHI